MQDLFLSAGGQTEGVSQELYHWAMLSALGYDLLG